MTYTGYKYFDRLPDELVYKILNGESDGRSLKLKENEYGIILTPDGDVMYTVRETGRGVQRVLYPTIDFSKYEVVKPLNNEQYCAIDMLMDASIPVKVLTGVFGSGKDYLMVNAALKLINSGEFDSLLYIRNNIEVKDTMPLGALPGEKGDKMRPWLMALADHVGGAEGLDELVSRRIIQAEHLGFMRGRDIKNTIVLSSEAENLTTQHVQLLLGRIGKGSALWLNGDYRQIDSKIFERNNGLRKLVDRLQGHKLFGYVHLPKSERSAVASLADLLDD